MIREIDPKKFHKVNLAWKWSFGVAVSLSILLYGLTNIRREDKHNNIPWKKVNILYANKGKKKGMYVNPWKNRSSVHIQPWPLDSLCHRAIKTSKKVQRNRVKKKVKWGTLIFSSWVELNLVETISFLERAQPAPTHEIQVEIIESWFISRKFHCSEEVK